MWNRFMTVSHAYSLARELRRKQTDSERILWGYLRNKKFHGLKFYRQRVIRYDAGCLGIKFFVADFYCPEVGLVVELDGKIHEKRKEYDLLRDSIINDKGIRTLRIKNSEIEDINATLNKIWNFIS